MAQIDPAPLILVIVILWLLTSFLNYYWGGWSYVGFNTLCFFIFLSGFPLSKGELGAFIAFMLFSVPGIICAPIFAYWEYSSSLSSSSDILSSQPVLISPVQPYVPPVSAVSPSSIQSPIAFPSPPPSVLTDLERLTRLRDSCLHNFHKKPLKAVPSIAIKSIEHFSKPLTLARYEPPQNVVCFKDEYVKEASYDELADTMIHELLHAWLNQHGPQGENKTWADQQDNPHDQYFEMMAQQLGIEFNPAWREQD